MYVFFFFNDTATTEIYTLSLHDALPIFVDAFVAGDGRVAGETQTGYALALTYGLVPTGLRSAAGDHLVADIERDRKSTRLNSSHANISYADFCLQKKKGMSLREQDEGHI